jgi:DNA mismatch endonuclease (patch repair protein)
MAAIRGRDTKPELLVRRFLHKQGLRYSLKSKLTGRPDLVFSRYRTVVFVHGCFWHRHHCPNGLAKPATRKAFWNAKLKGNVLRDARTKRKLQCLGWRVLVVWACEISPETLADLASRIRDVRVPTKARNKPRFPRRRLRTT